MNTHPPGEHLPSCSSPLNCAEYRSLLSMTDAEHAAWLKQDQNRVRLRIALARRTTRVSQPQTYDPPNPYTLALAAQRQGQEPPADSFAARHEAARRQELAQEQAALRSAQPLRRLSASELARFEPPNSYALALAALKGTR